MAYGNKTRFSLLIGGSILIALLLVTVSVSLYFSSGTAQLDLSRPGYQSVRDQGKTEDPYKGYASSGPVDADSFDEFERLFKQRATNATSLNAFDDEVLSDAALGIDDEASLSPSE